MARGRLGAAAALPSGRPRLLLALLRRAARLAAERTLLLLDPRGTGDSDRPTDRSAYDIEAVRGELRLERLDLLGHSHGGFVAMAWAGTNPGRVGKLILAATAPRFTGVIRGARMERVVSHQGRPYFDDALAALHDQQAGKYDSDEQLAALYERAAPILAPLGEDTAAVAEAFRAAGLNADALKQFNERIAPTMDLRPLLARVEAPTLVIAGDRDPFGGATVDEIAEALPDPTVVRVPGADHFIFLEPDGRPAWSRAVLEFLTG